LLLLLFLHSELSWLEDMGFSLSCMPLLAQKGSIPWQARRLDMDLAGLVGEIQ
jgi:hypothetical protein